MKKHIIWLFLLLLTALALAAQEATDLYTQGFNDAYSTLIYNTKYDIKKLNRKLRRRMSRKTLSEEDIAFLEKAAEYNEGFLDGLAEKYRLDANPSRLDTAPFSDEEDLSFTKISVPLQEE